jgi:hypothetical protein
MSYRIERTDGACEITHVCKVSFAEPECYLAPESVVDKGAVHIDVEENRGNSITFSTEIYAQPTNPISLVTDISYSIHVLENQSIKIENYSTN